MVDNITTAEVKSAPIAPIKPPSLEIKTPIIPQPEFTRLYDEIESGVRKPRSLIEQIAVAETSQKLAVELAEDNKSQEIDKTALSETEGKLREPKIAPLEDILLPRVKEDLQNRTVATNEAIGKDQLTQAPFGSRRNCVEVEGGRRITTDVYHAVLESFGDRVGKEVEVKLAYKQKEEVKPVDQLEGKGSIVVVTEKVAPEVEVIYVVEGDFAGPAVTGSTKELGHGVSYTRAEQIIIHDLESNQATDISSFLLPETQLRYAPVAADSESSRKYFAQGTGKYLQLENITNPERLAGILHEAGHERLQTKDPKPSEEAAEIINRAPGGALQMLPKEDLIKLAQLLPTIEKGASDEALTLIQSLQKGGINIGTSPEEVKRFFNQGLSAHQESLRRILPGENISFKLYETG